MPRLGRLLGRRADPADRTYKGFYDFQKWLKTYQFWVRTGPDGGFTIPHVHPDERYMPLRLRPWGSGHVPVA